jgi:epoxyqueuosine reductase QueG
MQNEIIEAINSTVIEYDKNNKVNKLWKDPIIEFVSAGNIKLQDLKKTVCSDHFMPHDILPDAKTIISYFIPFQEYIVKSNIKGTMASTEWAVANIKTDNLTRIINESIEVLMRKTGNKAGKISVIHSFDTKKLVSTWSHMHIAYIAGMGAFGINNMLITKNGCCGRFGSILIDYKLDEYKKVDEVKEKCLNKLYGICKVCQTNCVAKCFEKDQFDREKCYEQCLKNRDFHKKYGHADVCGKCQVNLPCSMNEPEVAVQQ